MKTYTIKYGDSNWGYSTAIAAVGPRGGIKIIKHNGNRKRVTHSALADTVRAHISGKHHLSLVTTAQDCLPVRVEEPR